MKPLSPFPPPPELLGQDYFRITAKTVSEFEAKGEPIFQVVDPSVPYVELTAHFTMIGSARENPPSEPGSDDGGPWPQLEPDYLAQDEGGTWVFFMGDGATRSLLGRLGIKKREWLAIPENRRKLITAATNVSGLAEVAAVLAIREEEPAISAAAVALLRKFRDLSTESASYRFLAERWRSTGFRWARTLRDFLVPHLERVRQDGQAKHRRPFGDVEWQAQQAAEINELAIQFFNIPPQDWQEPPPRICKAEDIAKLSTMTARALAITLAAREGGVSPATLKYKKLRFRSKKGAKKR